MLYLPNFRDIRVVERPCTSVKNSFSFVYDFCGVTSTQFEICLLLQGLRHSVFLGSLGTCLGSWIKVFATNRAHFGIMFAGQTVVAISQIFILGIPPQLAATWFPSHQVSSACAIGVFGNQVSY